ncbi:MAG: hypothetical protein HY245_15095 [Rhizobiales bacterium]|nr:hypothetical protein [Hyphomicrobiales bacterium]MBI3674714.1 hypothetical protein [Hyphomicrobiales bacterium]
MRKIIAIAIAIAAAALSTPARAAASFYVVQDPKTKQCTVDTTKPDGKTGVAMNSVPYKSKNEATKAMKADPNCAK